MEEKKSLLFNLPPYYPELNLIELEFQFMGVKLRHSNVRHKPHDTINDDYFVFECVEVLESISNDDLRKNYKKILI